MKLIGFAACKGKIEGLLTPASADDRDGNVLLEMVTSTKKYVRLLG